VCGVETGQLLRPELPAPSKAAAPIERADCTPLDYLRAALDELVDAGVLDRRRRAGIE